MPKIVLTSFTPLDAPGGVPRFNRDFVASFPPGTVEHYSWWDALPSVGGKDDPNVPEWDKARVLAAYLRWSGKVTEDDVVVGDGFWADGYWPHRTVSHSHGIWSHLTKEDVQAGMQPEFPFHHAAQVRFRADHLRAGGRLTACSLFIADSMRRQWGFRSEVINNGIDLRTWRPEKRLPRTRPIVMHGVHNRDANKGWDHVEAVRERLDANVVLYDEATHLFPGLTKPQVLAQADLVLAPSRHEGNSYFLLEALASGVPVLCYNVGLMYEALIECSRDSSYPRPGEVLERSVYSPSATAERAEMMLADMEQDLDFYEPRRLAERFSWERFRDEWRGYMAREFGLAFPEAKP